MSSSGASGDGGGQLSLFAGDPELAEGVRPAAVTDEVRSLAATLPSGVRLGTSSWSFPGWQGLVYAGRHDAGELAREGLSAYSQHPLFRSVGLDRTYYGPMSAEELGDLAEQTPPDFRFMVKAHEDCTVVRFPDHPRYGARQGESNLRFLDASYARDEVVGPTMEGLGERLGELLFQFPPMAADLVGGPERFATTLFRFLDGLPRGPRYAVELRSRGLFRREVVEAIYEAGGIWCLNVHPSMPTLAGQWSRVRELSSAPVLVRWMLRQGRSYAGARDAWSPFDRVAEVDEGSRTSIAAVIADAVGSSREVTVIANNKAEGCSPESLRALAEQIISVR